MNLDFPLEIERRAFQRTMSVLVRPSGTVKVTCGKMVTKYRLAQFLYENRDWIEKRLFEQLELRQRYPKKTFQAGERFLYLGEQKTLEYRRNDHRIGGKGKRFQFSVLAQTLLVEVSADQWNVGYLTQAQPHLEENLKRFYKKSAQQLMDERVQLFSQQMGLAPKSVSYRSQKTRWGSCSSEGKISLNWRLIAAPLEVLDYVVVHELAHLKYQNHSKLFWNLVAEHCGRHKEKRQWLRDHVMEFDFLAKKSELHSDG